MGLALSSSKVRVQNQAERVSLPRVSLVTPSYNQGRFLRRTIESVLGQDYPGLEYLLFDGGSTDESLPILRSYGNRFFWVSEPDRGQAHAINKGLARAQGDIVGFLNSDDVLVPGALERVVRHFQDHPHCQVVYGQAYVINEEDRVLGQYPTAEFHFERLLGNCFLCQPATFWRREVVEECGLLDESLHYALDYEYWLRLAARGVRFERLPTVLACTRAHAGTKTSQGRLESYREVLAVAKRYARQAGFSQYFAYWHHRCRKRGTGWPRWLRAMPSAHYWLSLLHYRWDKSGGRLLSFLKAGIGALLKRLGKN